jgi:hypothetical protein
MNRYALVDNAGIVQSNIIWDGISEWQPPDGLIAVLNPDDICAGIGWTYIDGVFTSP